MCHAMPFSARALKKNIFFDVDIAVKNKSKCGLSWSVLLPTTSTCHYSFPKRFFHIVSAYYASLKEFLKGKSDAYKQLICIMQRVHFKSESVFSVVKPNIYFVLFDIVVKKTNRMWFSVVCTLIDNDTCHHSGQNVVDSRGAAE